MLALAGCGGGSESGGGGDVAVVRAWAHSGQEAEREVLTDQVARFNALNSGVRVELTIVPEGAYNAQVQSAALAGELPDLLEFDGPFLYNYVWQRQLRPLDGLLDAAVVEDLLPSLRDQGTFRGRLWSVGVFDSGLGLYGSRSALEEVGARIPASPAEAWSAVEFESLLERLHAGRGGRPPLDLKVNYRGEWYAYAFSPVLQSAGGDLIDRGAGGAARGTLDGPASVAAMERLQGWFRKGWVDPNLDDAAFIAGRVALSWSGHWDYARYAEALGEDLVVLPLPDFGEGVRTGMGSWNWGITAKARTPEAAARFLEFLLQKEEVLAMSGANGAVPGTRSALAASERFGPGGALALFARQLSEAAVPRPKTPAYPVITSVFAEAFEAIRNGENVAAALGRAAERIDRDIADNEGYPFEE